MNLAIISYIRNYFETYFNTYYSRLNKQETDKIVYDICEDISGKYNLIQVREGMADGLISRTISTNVHQKYPGLFETHLAMKTKVNKVIENSYNKKYSIITNDLIVERVVSIMIDIYGYTPGKGDNFENKICVCYQQVDKGLRNAMMQYVIQYVKEYITKSELPLLYVDVNEVAKIMVMDVMTTNSINAASLLNGRYGKIIEEYVKKNNKENEIKKKQQKQVIDSNGVEPMQKQTFSFNTGQVISQVNNQVILDNVNRMKSGSIKSKGKPDKIKKVSKRRKMTKYISTLLVLVTLLNVGSGITKKIVENVNENNAINRAEEFYDFNHSAFYLNDEVRYDSMANYVISYYFEVEELGNEHFYSLGFYNLLHSGKVTDEELDIVLRLVQEKVSKNDDFAELEPIFCNNLSYLDFIYGRLVAMGCEEIKEEKYQNAILAYKHSNFANHYGIPADNLYQYEKDLIQEIKELYEKYNRDYMLQLGEQVQFDGYTYYLNYETDAQRRNV